MVAAPPPSGYDTGASLTVASPAGVAEGLVGVVTSTLST